MNPERNSGIASVDNWRDKYSYSCTDLENNRFHSELLIQNTICEYSPLLLSTLARPTENMISQSHTHANVFLFLGVRLLNFNFVTGVSF